MFVLLSQGLHLPVHFSFVLLLILRITCFPSTSFSHTDMSGLCLLLVSKQFSVVPLFLSLLNCLIALQSDDNEINC